MIHEHHIADQIPVTCIFVVTLLKCNNVPKKGLRPVVKNQPRDFELSILEFDVKPIKFSPRAIELVAVGVKLRRGES